MKEMRRSVDKNSRIIGIVLFFSLSVLFMIGYASQDQMMMAASLLSIFGGMFIYCLSHINEHITLFVFLVAFFTFLMGRMILPLFYDISNLVFDIGGYDFSVQTKSEMYLLLFLALLFVWIGYLCYHKSTTGLKNHIKQDACVGAVRKCCRNLMYVTYLFALLITIEKVYDVIFGSYAAMYIDAQSRFPYVVTLIAGWFYHCFFVFLATLPTKKQAKAPIIMYLILATLSLGTGQRGTFVLGWLFVLMYMFLRNTIEFDKKEVWIGKKGIIAIILALPVLLIFLFLMVYIRSDRDLSTSSNLLVSFFYQQGVSVEVIGYTIDNEHLFPEGKTYLLGDFVDYFEHNIFSRVLFGTSPTVPQSVEHALNDNNLDATLTYLVKPDYYLIGGGLGGCYIADAWKDLGMFGVCIVSFFYGSILAKIPIWLRKNIWISSIGLVMFNQIIFAPRASALKPLYVFISVNVIAAYFVVYYVYKYKKRIVKGSK